MPGIRTRPLALTLGIVLTLAACSSTKHADTPAASSTTAARSATTGAGGAPTTTSAAVPVDPLPGAVLLGIHGRAIDAIDAHGKTIKTLVTVFAGRRVVNARLMPDHRTVWYATQHSSAVCDEIVKLDLRTNERTLVAFAHDFTLNDDGSRLLLVWPALNARVRASCQEWALTATTTQPDALVLRDLATGAQSTVAASAYPTAGTGSPSGHVWISPAGDRLVDSTCTNDPCTTRTITVPPHLGAPLVVGAFGSGPQCGCSTLYTGHDGVYAVDIGSDAHRETRLLRYDPSHVTGQGTVLTAPPGLRLRWVAPAPTATYALAGPVGSAAESLYRLDGARLTRLAATSYDQIFAIPPFVGRA